MVKQNVTIRRAPKMTAFIASGIIVAVIVAAIVSFGMPADPAVGAGATFTFFALVFSLVGMAVGAIVGLAVDRATRSTTGTADIKTLKS
jgi:hypothetical protein